MVATSGSDGSAAPDAGQGLDALDHFYKYADVYEALDATRHLEWTLARLRRSGLMEPVEWERCKSLIGEVRSSIESRLGS